MRGVAAQPRLRSARWQVVRFEDPSALAKAFIDEAGVSLAFQGGASLGQGIEPAHDASALLRAADATLK